MKVRFLVWVVSVLVTVFVTAPCVAAASAAGPEIGDYEGRPVASVEVVLEGSPPDAAAQAEFVALLQVAPNSTYSIQRVRASLQALFDSGDVANARVEVRDAATGNAPAGGGAGNNNGPINVRFVVRRQVRVGRVLLDLGLVAGTPVSEDELRGRLNMLEPGARVSQQTLSTNADLIQAYLRDRGFYRADVSFTQQIDPTDASGTRATITYHIKLGEQARVNTFNIKVQGFDPARVRPSLELQPGVPFTRTLLGEDFNRIRQAIINSGHLAPQLNDPQVTLDSERNLIDINLTGGIGPKVEVAVAGYEVGDKKARELLPVRREGSLDYSAIVEGERRLRNQLQENGYFFAEVTAICTVTPPTPAIITNGTPETCEGFDPTELSGRTVAIRYDVDRGRRFKLTDIRIEGTKQLTYEDVADELRTKKANALGFIPLLGYGRGYTSRDMLDQDAQRIRAMMRDLGYRQANVQVRQGVSLEGENLIVTFVVNEGELTRIAGIEVRGNQIYTDAKLREELKTLACRDDVDSTRTPMEERMRTELRIEVGSAFSRTQARAGADCLLNLYARDGYVNARVDFSVVELPKKGSEEQVRLVYTVTNEGDKVFIGRILVNGNAMTKKEAILKTITLQEGEVLRADKVAESERLLYATDAFRQVIIRTQPSEETASGFKKNDVIIEVEELKPRILSYGGGYSTDNGPLGLVDIRNVNLFGKLQQGTFRARGSNRQQLVRLEYFDPRFRRVGGKGKGFAPLSISAQYLVDSTVTRFFRSTIDRGNFGIVQRLDEEGKPIDEFGQRVGTPTINRLTFNIETQRDFTLDLGERGRVKKRSTLYLRYNYEDVRLRNLSSLLLAPILRPDRAIRLSRLGATFVHDTRNDPLDARAGEFLTVDYGLALRQLGGNLSFSRFQSTYRRYYQLNNLRGTVLAGSVVLGLANLFNPRDRNDNGVIDDIDRTLPISERFFSGGSTTLRGFDFEEAGPRVVLPECFLQNPVPRGCGLFRNNKGELVTLNPFTVPIGGNAMAVVNLEARVPVSDLFQVVPFYDGGNVFRRVGDLFGRNDARPDESSQVRNLRAQWTHTVGLGIRVKTPIGGAVAVDYGFLLDPPEFILPSTGPEPSIHRLKRTQLHFRFSQAF